jgi:hypothetical protein
MKHGSPTVMEASNYYTISLSAESALSPGNNLQQQYETSCEDRAPMGFALITDIDQRDVKCCSDLSKPLLLPVFT